MSFVGYGVGRWGKFRELAIILSVRQSYGDSALIEERPAQLFLEHEAFDLISFIEIGIDAGWDFVLLTYGLQQGFGLSR
jgi:hypothetical protein